MFAEVFKTDSMGKSLIKLKDYVDKGRLSRFLISTEKNGYTAITTLHLKFVFMPYEAFGEIDFKVNHVATELEKRKAIELLARQATEFLKRIK